MAKLKKKTVLEKKKPVSVDSFQKIKEWYEENLHPDKLDLKDQKVYKNVYEKGQWGGIFQATEKGAQKFFQKAKPKSVVDIAALTSIYRPGPLNAKVDKTYVQAKNNPTEVHYEHPLLKEALEDTYGHIIFQEQLMKLGNMVGGLSLDDCDKLRKVITKRSMSGQSKAKEEAKKLEKQFIDGAEEKGLTRELASEIFEKIAYFSGYGFNASLEENEEIPIFTKDGEFLGDCKVKNIQPGDYVKSRCEDSGDDIFVEVKELHDHKKIETFEIELDDGNTVTCTLDHKFRVTDGRMLPVHQIMSENLEIISL